MTNEKDKDIAGGIIYQINKERCGHFMGDCAGDKCPDWIERQTEIVSKSLVTVRGEERKAAFSDAIRIAKDFRRKHHDDLYREYNTLSLVEALGRAAENRKDEG